MEKRRVFQPLTRTFLDRAVPYRTNATDFIIGFFLFCKKILAGESLRTAFYLCSCLETEQLHIRLVHHVE